MRSLSDVIENYLQKALEEAKTGVLEIQRNELSEKFGCSPSQINYVLETRFSAERGYVIESRRGGGGYIRIWQIRLPSKRELVRVIHEQIGDLISQERAMHLVRRLQDSELISDREVKLIEAAIDRKTLHVDLPIRDMIRARILKAMLLSCLQSA